MKKLFEQIIVEQEFESSLEALWEAISDINKMKKWYFENIPDFKPEVGFSTSFKVENEGRVFTHNWRVTEVIPGKSLKYEWKYEEYPGNSLAEFELFRSNNRSKLKLTHSVLENFPENIPEFKRESGVAGWNYFIRESLKNYLENPK